MKEYIESIGFKPSKGKYLRYDKPFNADFILIALENDSVTKVVLGNGNDYPLNTNVLFEGICNSKGELNNYLTSYKVK